mmetsp:Transcript_22942/g.57994  ORF Transcript_22942/g.57994 Transcript_22942/m.57994 type:complete len:116 (-) Transcript_22942:8-355(-)
MTMALAPPGWSGRNLVTSKTSPSIITQQSPSELCFATSAAVTIFFGMNDKKSIVVPPRTKSSCVVAFEASLSTRIAMNRYRCLNPRCYQELKSGLNYVRDSRTSGAESLSLFHEP